MTPLRDDEPDVLVCRSGIDPDVITSPGDWHDDVRNLYILESITVPLPASERRRLEQMHDAGTGGVLTRETIMRVLLGEFEPPSEGS